MLQRLSRSLWSPVLASFSQLADPQFHPLISCNTRKQHQQQYFKNLAFFAQALPLGPFLTASPATASAPIMAAGPIALPLPVFHSSLMLPHPSPSTGLAAMQQQMQQQMHAALQPPPPPPPLPKGADRWVIM